MGNDKSHFFVENNCSHLYMLTDKFHRIHNYLRISLTDKCNLRCSYCMPYDLPKGFFASAPKMSAEEIYRIASVFVKLGVKRIRFTGGEPLIRRDFHDILQKFSQFPVELNITTNGVFVDEYIEDFKKAGIKSVNVSLDTFSKEKFFNITKRDIFDRVMNNIHLLLLKDFHVKINVVLVRNMNDDELLDFIAWTRHTPVHVRFIEFMPFNGNRWEEEKIVPLDEAIEKIKSCYEVVKLKDELHDTTKKYHIPGHAGTFAFISTVSKPFCEGCNRIRLTADGKLRNCLFAKTETDLLTPLRKGEDLAALIESTIYKKEFMRGGNNDFTLASSTSQPQEFSRCMVSIGG